MLWRNVVLLDLILRCGGDIPIARPMPLFAPVTIATREDMTTEGQIFSRSCEVRMRYDSSKAIKFKKQGIVYSCSSSCRGSCVSGPRHKRRKGYMQKERCWAADADRKQKCPRLNTTLLRVQVHHDCLFSKLACRRHCPKQPHKFTTILASACLIGPTPPMG